MTITRTIKIQSTRQGTNKTTEHYRMFRLGMEVGHMMVVEGPRGRYPEDIRVHPAFRRQGIATRLLVAATEHGELEEPPIMTDAGRRHWEAWQAMQEVL